MSPEGVRKIITSALVAPLGALTIGGAVAGYQVATKTDPIEKDIRSTPFCALSYQAGNVLADHGYKLDGYKAQGAALLHGAIQESTVLGAAAEALGVDESDTNEYCKELLEQYGPKAFELAKK